MRAIRKLCIGFLFIAPIFLMGQVGVRTTEWDFGIVSKDTESVHVFEIENATPGPLIVETVEAG